MKIKNYISKDLVIGAIGGSILATIITSIIDTKAVDKANEELELSNDEFEKKLEEDLEKINDQEEVIEAQGSKIQELEDELKEYDNEDFKEWMRLKETFKVNKGTYGEWLLERDKQQKKQQEIETVKKAIEEKDWNTVYNKSEHWYNHNPVDMARYEVFGYLREDGYVTNEQVKEARDYYGSLWNYVGD